NPAQIACIELRKASYLSLDHAAFLELLGSRPSRHRREHFRASRARLSPAAAAFWDAHPEAIEAGIGSAGKFERYFSLFRRFVLPLAHPRRRVEALLEPRSLEDRQTFYRETWNNRRWRAIFRLFFSR